MSLCENTVAQRTVPCVICLQSRYYDPEICRFINADSTDYLGATGTLLSYNLFAYCENDGVNYVDPEGTTLGNLIYTSYKSSSYLKKQNKNSVLLRSKNSEVLISVYNNSILISAYMNIYGDLTQQKISNMYYKNAFIKGIEKIWSGKFIVWGEEISLKTKIYLSKNYSIKVNMLNKWGTSQRTSNMSNWKPSNLGSIKIYKGANKGALYNLEAFYKVCAHEFGHLLGCMETKTNSVTAKDLKNFALVANDIVRVLTAFITNKPRLN